MKNWKLGSKNKKPLASCLTAVLLGSLMVSGTSGCSTAARGPAPHTVAPFDSSSSFPEVSSLTQGDELPRSFKADDKNQESQASYHFSLGQSHSLEGNADKAIEEYKLALVYDAESAVIHTRLATEYVRRGLLTLAIDECKNAIKYDAKYVDARLLLAGLYGATKLIQEAIAEYDAILKIDGKNTEAYVFKGSLLLEENRSAEAVGILKKLVAMDPESHLGFYYLGRAYQQMAKVDLAVKAFRQALDLKPGLTQAVLSLGLLLEENKRQKEAIQVYEQAYAENHDNHVTARLAQISIDKNDYKGALKYLQTLEQLDEDNLNVRVKIGLIYIELKSYAKAAETFENILKRSPDAERVRFYLGSVYEEMKAVDKAIDVFSKVDPKSSSYTDAAVHVGYLYKMKGDVHQALNWIEEAIKQNPDSAQYYTFKASLLEDLHKVADAIDLLERVSEKFGKDERLLYYLGSLYEKAGNQNKALGTMKKLLLVNADNANALNYIGYTLAVRGEDLQLAESMVRRAVALKPNDGYVMDSLGFILLKKGQVKDATKELEKAFALRPDEPVILEHLGDAYLKNNLRLKALQKYKEASRLYGEAVERNKLERKISSLNDGKHDGKHDGKQGGKHDSNIAGDTTEKNHSHGADPVEGQRSTASDPSVATP